MRLFELEYDDKLSDENIESVHTYWKTYDLSELDRTFAKLGWHRTMVKTGCFSIVYINPVKYMLLKLTLNPIQGMPVMLN